MFFPRAASTLSRCLLLLLCSALCRTASASRVSIEWTPVRDAIAYHLRILNQETRAVVKDTTIPIHSWTGRLPEGAYVFQIQSVSRGEKMGAWTGEKAFAVGETSAREIRGTGEVGISEGVSGYGYDGGGAGPEWSPTHASALANDLRLDTEYWWFPRLAIQARGRLRSFEIAGKDFTRRSVQLGAAYGIPLADQTAWLLVPSLGLGANEYFAFSSTEPSTAPSLQGASAYCAVAGLELEWVMTPIWRWAIRGDLSFPLGLFASGLPPGTSLRSGDAFGNFRLGFRGEYFLAASWAVSLEIAKEKETLAFLPPTQASAVAVSLSAVSVSLALRYHFGG